jgi:flagellar basal-body rod modification protein FlgD
VIIQIRDSNGLTVRNINMGSKASGSHSIAWDGKDNDGKLVEDGTYTYGVLANSGGGYAEVDNSVTGTAEGVAYKNNKAYLVVQGLFLDPDKLTSVLDVSDDEVTTDSAMTYLGKTVESFEPLIRVSDGVVSGADLSFNLDRSEAVRVNIYDPFNNLVRTIEVDASDTSGGENTVHWDAVGSNGYQVDNGLYYYTVKSESGTATTPVEEEVSGIRNTNGVQYLVLAESGRLVSPSSVKAVNN